MVPKLRFTSFKDTWSSAYLSQLIVSLDAGVSVNSIDELPDDNEYSILKTSCVSFGYFDERERKKVVKDEISRLKEILLSNSILISRMNTPALVGANAYIKDAPINTFVPDRLWQVKVNDNICNIKWLASFLSSDKGRHLLKEQASGTSNSMKNITKKDVFQIMLAFPCKEEQTIIADFLSSVDEKITLLNKQYDLLCQYKKGIMQKIFSQEVRFKDENGKEFPKWETCELKKFLIPTLREVKKPTKNFLSVGIRSHFKGTFHKNDQDPNKVSVDKLFLVHEGDFILNITFAWEGALAIARKEDHLGYVSHRFPTYTFKKEFMSPIFFRYIYTLPKFITNLDLCSPGGAGRNRVLKKSEFIEIEIDKPCMAEQIKIANFLSALDDKIAVKKADLDKLKIWKQGLLQQMFV